MQDSWLSKTADEIQSFADRKDTKKFFDAPHSLMQMEPVFWLTK